MFVATNCTLKHLIMTKINLSEVDPGFPVRGGGAWIRYGRAWTSDVGTFR